MELQTLDVEHDYVQVAEVWQTLCRATEHSYFLSWGWVEAWLHTLRARKARLELALLLDSGEVVGAFFLGCNRLVRKRLFRSRGLFLNATGIPAYDSIYIEFNAILARAGAVRSWGQLLELLPGGWQELVLPGLDRDGFPGNVIDQVPPSLRVALARDDDAPFVDLEAVRRRGDYLALLGGSTRSNIRRTRRLYAGAGEVCFEVADTPEQARAFFAELLELHDATWEARGKRSGFTRPYVLEFHRALIRHRFAAGEIQLARLRVGDDTIGSLYNFVYDGRVYNYQSGFRYSADNRLKPGLLCHAEAIAYNAGHGAAYYDFLAGEQQYKRNLATGSRRLTWVRLQKPHPQFWLERQVEQSRRVVSGRLQVATAANRR